MKILLHIVKQSQGKFAEQIWRDGCIDVWMYGNGETAEEWKSGRLDDWKKRGILFFIDCHNR